MAGVTAGASAAEPARARVPGGYRHCEDSLFQGQFCVIVDWRNSALSTHVITEKVEGAFVNCSKSYRCPKVVKQNLLGSQK